MAGFDGQASTSLEVALLFSPRENTAVEVSSIFRESSFAQGTWKLTSSAEGGPWKRSLCAANGREGPGGNFHQVWGPCLYLVCQVELYKDRRLTLSASVPPPHPLLPKENPKASPCQGACIWHSHQTSHLWKPGPAPPTVLTDLKICDHWLEWGISEEGWSWMGGLRNWSGLFCGWISVFLVLPVTSLLLGRAWHAGDVNPDDLV